MSSQAYRKAPGSEWILVVAALSVIAGEIALVPLIGPRPMQGWEHAYLLLPMVIPAVVAWAILAGRKRRRLAALAANLKALGLQANFDPPTERQALLWQYVTPLSQVLDLRGGPTDVQWYATVNGHTDPVCLFEFRFVTGSGRYSEEHIRTVITWHSTIGPAPGQPSAELHGFGITRYRWLLRRLHRRTELPLPNHPGVAKRWSATGSAATARLFLVPEVIAELDRAPKDEAWYMGHGWFCCCFRNTLHPEDVAAFFNRSKHMLQLVAAAAACTETTA